MPAESIAYQKALSFARRIVYLSRHLNQEPQDYVVSNKSLRSGTGVGANMAEARYGCSRKDFAAKIYVALKECSETLYWLELLHMTDYLSEEEYDSLRQDCEALRRMLSATTKSVR